jgi:hypothetical protein
MSKNFLRFGPPSDFRRAGENKTGEQIAGFDFRMFRPPAPMELCGCGSAMLTAGRSAKPWSELLPMAHDKPSEGVGRCRI